jgi:hypothetical protein
MPIEVERNATPAPIAPEDTSVLIPKSVKEAAAKAEAYYKTEPTAEEVAAAAAEAARTAEAEAAADEVKPKPIRAKKPAKPEGSASVEPVKQPDIQADQQLAEGDNWEHRYRSMKGRYDAAQQTIGSMQEQMSQLGDELMRTQTLLQGRQPQQQQRQQSPAPAAKLITQEDEQAFGSELIDLARRAAQETVGPELDALKNQNARLTQQARQDAKMRVGQLLDRDIPNWREINADPRFLNWLRLRDVYSGQVRKAMLDAAYQAANGPQVKAFFDGFIRDEAVTGNEDLAPQPERQSETPAAPQRQAAVPLSSLAAPGRAKPAPGATLGPADKPTFTRAQIAKFYSQPVRQSYVGREKERTADEALIFAAQREGRVR